MRVRTYRRYKNPDGSVTVVSNGMIGESARAAWKFFPPLFLAIFLSAAAFELAIFPWQHPHWPLWLKILITIPLGPIGITLSIGIMAVWLMWDNDRERRMKGLPPKTFGATKPQANNTARTRQQTAQLRAASWQKGISAFEQRKTREEQIKEQMRRNRENPRPRESYFAKLAAERSSKTSPQNTQ